MIEIRSLTREFGSFTAVDSITLDIPTGEVVGLLGPNGAGKTTTIRMLTGFLPPTRGQVTVEGFNSLSESHQVRLRLGYLPESNPLYTEMRVEEYLRFRGRIFGMPRNEYHKAVDRVIERCWLDEMRRRLIGRLSKGYRQRVGLAASLLHSPKVLVFDEPTSGLDPVQIRETRNLIRELAGDHTMILSSHILPEIEKTCDRIVIMARGKIRADGSVQSLREQAGAQGRYVVEVRKNETSNTLKESFAKLKGVNSVSVTTPDEGWMRYTLAAGHQAGDLRESIGDAVQNADVPVREISRESSTIEQLFVKIASGADDALGSTSSPAGIKAESPTAADDDATSASSSNGNGGPRS